jgi:hypothetical protein
LISEGVEGQLGLHHMWPKSHRTAAPPFTFA